MQPETNVIANATLNAKISANVLTFRRDVWQSIIVLKGVKQRERGIRGRSLVCFYEFEFLAIQSCYIYIAQKVYRIL